MWSESGETKDADSTLSCLQASRHTGPPTLCLALFQAKSREAIKFLMFEEWRTSECLNKKNTFCVQWEAGSNNKVCLPLQKGKENLTKSLSHPLFQYFKSSWLNSELLESGEIPFSLLQYLLQEKERKRKKKTQSAFPISSSLSWSPWASFRIISGLHYVS